MWPQRLAICISASRPSESISFDSPVLPSRTQLGFPVFVSHVLSAAGCVKRFHHCWIKATPHSRHLWMAICNHSAWFVLIVSSCWRFDSDRGWRLLLALFFWYPSSTQTTQTPSFICFHSSTLLPLNVIPFSLLLLFMYFFLSLMPQSQFVPFFPSHTSLL